VWQVVGASTGKSFDGGWLMASRDKPTELRLGEQAWAVLEAAIRRAIEICSDSVETEKVETAFRRNLPPEQQSQVTAVLEETATPTRAYRAGLAIQLAYGVASSTPLDLTKRHTGARGLMGVSGKFGALLRRHR
jgi:hypothetical protein